MPTIPWSILEVCAVSHGPNICQHGLRLRHVELHLHSAASGRSRPAGACTSTSARALEGDCGDSGRSSRTPSCGACPARAGATKRCPSPWSGTPWGVLPSRARRTRDTLGEARLPAGAAGGARGRAHEGAAAKSALFFVSDRGVGMDQAVAKGDDSAGVADPGCKAWVEV